jgi:hypothetical protein
VGLDALQGLLADLPVPTEDGRFVSQRVAMMVEVIRDFDRYLDVRWIPPEERVLASDPAFAIVDTSPNVPESVVFYVQSEADMDARVLERLIDIKRQVDGGTVLKELDAKNEAYKILQAKLFKEKLDEANDLAYSILKSPKHRYKHDGVIYE